MKSLLLTGLLLTSAIHGISKPELEREKIALEIQKEKDDLKVKLALISAGVTVLIIWLRGKGDDAMAFDKMMMDIFFK